MRFVYMDEAGISHDEPVAVVAGAIIDGDRQFKPIERYIAKLVDEYVPRDRLNSFRGFHAKELANGGKTFVRGEYPDEKRLQALRRVAGIPRRFFLPLVIGWSRKRETESVPAPSKKQMAIGNHTLAYVQCAIGVDQFMRRMGDPGELAICVAENNNDARIYIKTAHQFLYETPPKEVDFLPIPIERIVDTVHFAEKREAVLLQVADVAAYIFARFINGAPGSDLLMQIMRGRAPDRCAFDAAAGYQIFHIWADNPVAQGVAWYSQPSVASSLNYGRMHNGTVAGER